MSQPQAFRRQPQPSVKDLMKELILARGLKPGDRLPTEPEFSAELGVGRNAVREAVRALQSLGIIEVRHGYGMYLPEVSLATLSEGISFWSRLSLRDGLEALRPIAEVRSVMEISLITHVVGRLSDEDLDEMAAEVKTMADRAAKGQRSMDADRRFHEILYRPLDNWIMIGLLRAFWDSYCEIDFHGDWEASPKEIVTQHRQILSALREGDERDAVKAMERHFRPVLAPHIKDATRNQSDIDRARH